METFQPEGGGKGARDRGGDRARQRSDVNCLTDDCSQSRVGDVSSAGCTGVWWVSLAFSGQSAALHA